MGAESLGWIICLPIMAIIGVGYLRPVSKVELARLVREAGDNPKALNIASPLLAKRYVLYFSYEQALNRIKDVVADDQAERDIKSFQAKK